MVYCMSHVTLKSKDTKTKNDVSFGYKLILTAPVDIILKCDTKIKKNSWISFHNT